MRNTKKNLLHIFTLLLLIVAWMFWGIIGALILLIIIAAVMGFRRNYTVTDKEKIPLLREQMKMNEELVGEKKKKKYIFCWDEIPGNDNERLIEFLIQKFGIDWVKIAEIKKRDEGKLIRIANGEKFLSLRLNIDATKASLKIDDGRTYEFVVKKENGKPNIYKKKLTIITCLLLGILVIKFIPNLIAAFGGDLISIFFSAIYLGLIVGVYIKSRWGSLSTLIFQVFIIFIIVYGIFMINTFNTVQILSEISGDFIIIVLAWKEYRSL